MPPTFQQSEADALARGFDEVLVRRWSPNRIVDEPAHALVVDGAMWLTEADRTRHLRPGDTFALEPDMPHSERDGVDDAVCCVARRGRTLP